MSKYIAVANFALVINGTPYRLVRETKITQLHVCNLCGLRDICHDESGWRRLDVLCSQPQLSNAFFFKEDWEMSKHLISDYIFVDNNLEGIYR